VCGALYPDVVEVQGKKHHVFEFSKPKSANFMVFEVLGMPAGKNISVVKLMDNYWLELGRSGAEIWVPDVSVSKKQARIKLDMSLKEIIVEDANSKYGTHLLIQRPIPLSLDKPLFVVNGHSLIRMKMQRRKKKLVEVLCGCF
jgi:hypothetical protein